MLNTESEKTKCFTTKNCKKLVWCLHGSNKTDPSEDTTSKEIVYFPFASLKFYVPYNNFLFFDEYNPSDCDNWKTKMLENICNDNSDFILEKRPFSYYLKSKDIDLRIFEKEEKKK